MAVSLENFHREKQAILNADAYRGKSRAIDHFCYEMHVHDRS